MDIKTKQYAVKCERAYNFYLFSFFLQRFMFCLVVMFTLGQTFFRMQIEGTLLYD